MITSLIILLLLYALYLKISYKKPNIYGFSPSDNAFTNSNRYNEVPERDYNVHTRFSAEYYSCGYSLKLEFYPQTTSCILISNYELNNKKLNVNTKVKTGENAIAVAQYIRLITLAYLAHTRYAGDKEQKAYEMATTFLKERLDEQQYNACIKFYEELKNAKLFTDLLITK